MRTHLVIDSPIGALTLVAEGDSLVAVWMDTQRHLPDPERFGTAEDGDSVVLKEAGRQLAQYFAGERTSFELPLRADGTAFQRQVWAALREIPYGETISYGELARRIGKPAASRAVGLANGRNPLGIVVPCHRVIGASGKLVGYGGGLDRKAALLALERGTAAGEQLALG
ncbi:MAG: methylated-DNA--[protein]-cysteine S-methyltransferase [Sporichthyaceae bacterium]